ncbi:MAG: hypothetical protein Q9165_006282 [Trypethelium subeluteriae]
MGDRRRSYTINYAQNKGRRQNIVRFRDHHDDQDHQKNALDFVATQRCPRSIMRIQTTIDKLVIQNVYHNNSGANLSPEAIDESQDENDSDDDNDSSSAGDVGEQAKAEPSKDKNDQEAVNPEEHGSGTSPDGHVRLGSLKNEPFPGTHPDSSAPPVGGWYNLNVYDSECLWLRPLESEHFEERPEYCDEAVKIIREYISGSCDSVQRTELCRDIAWKHFKACKNLKRQWWLGLVAIELGLRTSTLSKPERRMERDSEGGQSWLSTNM